MKVDKADFVFVAFLRFGFPSTDTFAFLSCVYSHVVALPANLFHKPANLFVQRSANSNLA